MEGILAFNGYNGADPDDFYKAWFREPSRSYYPNGYDTFISKHSKLINHQKFTIISPKLLIQW